MTSYTFYNSNVIRITFASNYQSRRRAVFAVFTDKADNLNAYPLRVLLRAEYMVQPSKFTYMIKEI